MVYNKRWCLFCLSFALSGCGTLFTPRIDDLKFVSASTINILDHPEITWRGGKRPSLELLEIIFESHENILNVARKYELNITYPIFFCRDGPEKYTMGLSQISGLYSLGLTGEITAYISKDKNILKSAGKDSYEYRIYIELVKSARINPFGQSIPAYDLHEPPDNLCAKVHGGNMVGMYFNSNIFTIPKEAILEGIRSSRSTH